jgi:hypothetical protein
MILAIAVFSVLATLLTFVYLKPFLAHPWYHLAYWLVMYLLLFFGAPFVFARRERKEGGRLTVGLPLNAMTRGIAIVLLLVSLVSSLALFFRIGAVNQLLPWTLPPLVGGLIGVLFMTHAVGYGWALWDGDWIRTRSFFWQAPITILLFLLLPLAHRGDLRPETGPSLALYVILAAVALIATLGIILSYRPAEAAENNRGR